MLPRCLKKPLLVSVLAIIILFIIAIIICSKANCNTCNNKPQEQAIKTIQTEIEIIEQKEAQENMESQMDSKVKADVIEVQEADKIVVIRENFVNNGIVSEEFITKNSIFFDKSSSKITKKAKDKLDSIKNKILDSKLIIITGHACDLGNAEYNNTLIQKRMNNVINFIKKNNPNVEILYSNNGQTKTIKAKQERKQERRVDIYLYQ
ncbi:MAG: OmpA family protein [Helicobacteraceae bacterium]|nr:OmpA family protein [Helicobacteraceae bacterium]